MDNKPKIGQGIKVYGVNCIVTRIHAFGTLDCVSVDGTKAYRLTGLNFI